MISKNSKYAGSYGGLKKFGLFPMRRLNGRVALLASLGCKWSYSKCYRNPPFAPPFRNSLRKILRNFSKRKERTRKFYGYL